MTGAFGAILSPSKTVDTDINAVTGDGETLADRKLSRDIGAIQADGFCSFLKVLEDMYRRAASQALPA